MFRLLSTFFLILVLLFSFFWLFYGKDIYQVLPVNEKHVYEEANFQNWHEFTDPQGRFKVLLPKLPQHTSKTVESMDGSGDQKYAMFTSESPVGNLFMILTITYPETMNVAKQDDELKRVLDKLIKSDEKNRLKLQNLDELDGYETLNMAIENEENQLTAKAFFVNDTMYVLTSIARNQTYNPQEFLFFANSFELLQNSPLPVTPSTPK